MDLDLPFNEMFLKTSDFKPIFTEIKADLRFAQPRWHFFFSFAFNFFKTYYNMYSEDYLGNENISF